MLKLLITQSDEKGNNSEVISKMYLDVIPE
ncbi:MAG: hypothetical protein Pg6B_00110 [Candidatus Azobacteroides pseudotrichonymphae]|jgi:hypothetical protein|nr:MAG: hypothetical protein Pg6B_00110 [Candidatus Azobacteroides pseudotrichonymphae]